MSKKTLRAASYRRVSTKGQANDGLSLAEQAERIEAFAQENGWELVADYEDAGKSATKDFHTRPQFKRMIADALAGKFDVLLVYDMTRFSRNPHDYFVVNSELENAGVSLLTLDNPNFDAADDGQVLGREIQVVIGKFTAKQAREKSIRVKQSKLERGELNLGQRLPYGLRWVDREGTALEHDPHTYPTWCLMKALRAAGWGYGRIAEALNGDTDCPADLLDKFGVTLPVPNRFGQKIWREGSIASMFRDESRVTGRIEVDFKPKKNVHKVYTKKFPPMMTRAEFKRFRALSTKNLTWVPRNVGRGSTLSGLCRCGICGAKLHITGSKGRRHYGCANRLRKPRKGDKRCSLPIIDKKKLEHRVLFVLSEFLGNDKKFAEALERANVGTKDRAAVLAKLERDEKRLVKSEKECERGIARLVDAIVDGIIGKKDAKQKRRELADQEASNETRRQEIDSRRAALERTATHVKAVEAARQKYLSRFGSYPKLLALSDDEKSDLLRSLLPPDTGAGIVIRVADPADEIGEWFLDFDGILPIEDESIKKAVLGGALAVP